MLKMCFFILFFTIFSCFAFSGAKKKVTVEDIENGMVYIANGKLPKHFKIGRNKKNEILKNEKHRKELAVAIKKASEKYDLNPFLFVSIAFREGSFKRKIKSLSRIGERSTFQIAPLSERFIRKKVDKDCNTKTYNGAAICSAALFSVYKKICGNEYGAMVKYATGKHCEPKTKHQRWLVADRLGMTRHLTEYLKN